MNNHWAAIVVCIIATSCIADIDTPSGSGGGMGTPSGSGGGMATSSGSSGGNVPDGDAFPAGAVSFFQRLACPPDWSSYDDAAGRVIIAANAELLRGTKVGEPLSNGEDRLHEHNLSTTVSVAAVQLLAPEGGNGVLTSAGTHSFVATSAKTPAGVPYRQLLVCKKMVEPKADVMPLPAKLINYFDLDACPSGWKPVAATDGRIIVGLPSEAPADMPMGGEPITTPEPRAHTHTFSSTLVTSSFGVSSPNGPGGIFGQNGSYPFSGVSNPASADIPMIALLHCEKQ